MVQRREEGGMEMAWGIEMGKVRKTGRITMESFGDQGGISGNTALALALKRFEASSARAFWLV